jgi:tetratricopeptide (TPR) repeat protein
LWFEELSDELVAELQRFLEAGSYTARVAYGSSMGGYAAIRYARAFRVNRVVAISPLYDIRLPEDPRWLEDIPALQRPTMMTSEEVMPLCEYSIIFDPVCPDLLQINRFREILPAGQIHVVEIPDAGHPAEMFLHETGILKDLALSLLLGLRKDLQNYAIDPRTSPTYLNNLADRLFVSGKPGEALEPALAAHALDPDNPENLTLIARIYDDLDESAEAERFARRSMAIDATSPHRNTILVHILAKKHEFKEALEILEGVISLDPSIEHSHELYADLSAKMPEP